MSSLEHICYQLIISRLEGDHIASPSYQDRILSLIKRGIGGFIVFGGQKEEVRPFIKRMQSLTSPPLFIASDIERGVAQQIRDTTSFPPAMAIAAAIDRNRTEDIHLLEFMLKAVSDEAMDVGINMPLIPVLDVNINPDNPIICTRAFSDDVEKVAWFGSHFVRSIESYRLISCAKHFPGHGDTSIDSHISLPVISKSIDMLWEKDISPFRAAVKAGVSSIMVGHLSVPSIDSAPASLSHKVLTHVLRDKLRFEGLIITDALNMDALKGRGNIHAACLNAGVDILLHPEDAASAVKELKEACASGELNEGKVHAAHERVLRCKSKLNFNKKPVPDYQEHEKTASLMYDRSITLVKNAPPILPLSNMQETTLVYSTDKDDFDMSPLKSYIKRSIHLKECNSSDQRETAIFVLFTNIAAWRGSSGIKDEDIHKIKNLMKQTGKSIVIAFGSPYVLRHFNEADVLIAAYDSGIQAQLSVIRCLTGERVFKGSLPVTLHFS